MSQSIPPPPLSDADRAMFEKLRVFYLRHPGCGVTKGIYNTAVKALAGKETVYPSEFEKARACFRELAIPSPPRTLA